MTKNKEKQIKEPMKPINATAKEIAKAIFRDVDKVSK